MSKYARIDGFTAVEVFTPPEGFAIEDCFAPGLVQAFVACPADVTVGSTLNESGEWTAPAAPVDPHPAAPRVSPVEFKLLWTSAERVALDRFRRSVDPESADARDAVNDFFNLLDDPRLTFVDLGLASTRAGVESMLALLQGMGVVQEVQTREAEILAGVLQ